MMGSVGLTWAPFVIQLYQVAGNDRGGGAPIADGGGDKLFYIRNDIDPAGQPEAVMVRPEANTLRAGATLGLRAQSGDT